MKHLHGEAGREVDAAAAPKILVGMSGGVDSTVAALLLKKSGWRVCGCTFLLEGGTQGDHPAGVPAGKLGIEHFLLDASTIFEERVMRPCADMYAAGFTPNPCVLCNLNVKFGTMLEHAAPLGFDAMATGHYARWEDGVLFCEPRRGGGSLEQSYFLFAALPALERHRVLFPLADLDKEEVRRLAAEHGLADVLQRRSSKDMCLAADGERFPRLLASRYPGLGRPGWMVDTEGRKLRRHQGIHLYTIGQRRGLGVAMGKRCYVTGLEPETSSVIVSTDPSRLEAVRMLVCRCRWSTTLLSRKALPPSPPGPTGDVPSLELLVKIRYRHRPARAKLTPVARGPASGARFSPDGRALERVSRLEALLEKAGVGHSTPQPLSVSEDLWLVEFETPQKAVTPGQAAVFLMECGRGRHALAGGGWIAAVLPAPAQA